MQVLELEGLKFTARDGGLGLRTPGNHPPYGLSWLAVEKLQEWLALAVAKHRGCPTIADLIEQGYRPPLTGDKTWQRIMGFAAAPSEPVNLEGWKAHPSAPGYYYKGEEVRSYEDLANECRGLSPEALTAAVWNGEGAPPAGCECEAMWCSEPLEYLPVFIVGQDNGLTVFRWRAGKRKGEYGTFDPNESAPYGPLFRPLRTAEQLAAEAREKAILAIAEVICKDGAFDLEDPEVKASATALYAAGCRLA